MAIISLHFFCVATIKTMSASPNEMVQRQLTRVRREVLSVNEKIKESARRMIKAPDEKERLKAAELLGKRYGIFTDKMNFTGAVPIIIEDVPDEEGVVIPPRPPKREKKEEE